MNTANPFAKRTRQATNPVPRTQYLVLRTQHRSLRTRYSVPSPAPFARLHYLAAFLLLVSSTLLSAQSPPPGPRLPWETPAALPGPVLRPPNGPAEVFERLGVGESQLDHFTTQSGLSASEEDVLVKILYHLPRLGLDNLHRWRKENPDWQALTTGPEENRLSVLPLAGRVTRVTKKNILPEQVELLEFDHYFLVHLSLAKAQQTAIIATRTIPAAWLLDVDLDEPAAADGLFLKHTDEESASSELYFAAPRVAWFPDQPQPKNNIGSPQLALARLGFDAGLWDNVRNSDKHALSAGDREAFYQLLAAVGRDQEQSIKAAARQPFDLVALLDKSAQHHGDIGRLSGVARRVLRVPVSDLDVRVRLGIDFYYEIDLFLPLNDANLLLGKDPTGEKNPVYRGAFPATLLVRELPPDLREGENQHTEIAADAAFFKVWAYRSPYAGKFGQLQPAPLFIARTASVVEVPSHANWVASTLVTTALCVALGVTLLMAWWYRAGDRPPRRATAQRLDLNF